MHFNLSENKIFRSLNTLSFRMLRRDGVGVEVKQADVLSLADEETLWSKGVYGLSTGLKLQRTIYYSLGKNFALRGAEQVCSFLNLKDKERSHCSRLKINEFHRLYGARCLCRCSSISYSSHKPAVLAGDALGGQYRPVRPLRGHNI